MSKMLFYKVISLLIITLYFDTISTAQSLSGTIRDTNGNPIPYAAIKVLNHSLGTVSDIDGYFSLDSIPDFPFVIEISNLSYITSKHKIEKDTIINIVLKDKIFSLDNITIASFIDSIHIGSPIKPKSNTLYKVEAPFHQIGIILKNSDYEDRLIKSVSFNFYKGPYYSIKPDGESKLRLRIYSISEKNIGIQDLLNENIILTPKDKGWFTVNLEKQKIILPKDGILIALEWLEDSPKMQLTNKNKRIVDYGLALKAYNVDKRPVQSITLPVFYSPFLQKWHHPKTTEIPAIRVCLYQ